MDGKILLLLLRQEKYFETAGNIESWHLLSRYVVVTQAL